MAAARATENQAMKTPRQLAGLMNSLPLSSNFEVCLRGGERLHNPVSRGMEEGKPLKVAPGYYRCFWTPPWSFCSGLGSSPERMAERTQSGGFWMERI